MSARLATLGDDDVGADLAGLVGVFRMADHVGVEDAGFVEFLDDGFGGDADGADEDFGATFDDNIDEFVQLAFCVVNLANMLEDIQFNRSTWAYLRWFSERFRRLEG